MSISRRSLFRGVAAGAVAGAAISGLPRPSYANQGLGPIHLDQNENAYGPSEKTIAAMRDAATVANRYPQKEADVLTNTIARTHGVAPEQVVLGCGSTEVLRMAADAFLDSSQNLVMASPNWGLIADFARNRQAEVVAVPLNKEFAHDLAAMSTHVDSSAGLVYICNPHNPTGSLTARTDLELFLKRLPSRTRVVIDEAYHHYALSSIYTSFIDRPVDDDRLLVTRTFSGICGLAGLRVGYGITAPRTARLLSAVRLPSSLNLFAARGAVAALGDAEYVKACAERNASQRQEFLNQANARMLRAIDSQTNFVMLNTGCSAASVVEHYRKNDILLPPPFSPMEKYVRVSLGKPDEMLAFWRVWDQSPFSKMSMPQSKTGLVQP